MLELILMLEMLRREYQVYIIILLNGGQEKLRRRYSNIYQESLQLQINKKGLGEFAMNKRKAFINDFYHAHRGFGYLKSLHVYRDEEDVNLCNLDIALGNQQTPEKKMLIHFSGVVNFKSADLNTLFILCINVIDVSADQMEDINYKIREDEFDLFSFYCDNFEFELI